jgi:uncharacterized protein with PQ loop repeat
MYSNQYEYLQLSNSSSHPSHYLSNQELYGWIGDSIFIIAQLSQVYHTYKVKRTKDLSYVLICLFAIGNIMYTTFGIIDNSYSMSIGNGITVLISFTQFAQKVYYDNYYEFRDLGSTYEYDEIN